MAVYNLQSIFLWLLLHRITDLLSLKELQQSSNLTIISLKILTDRASSRCLHTPRVKELTTHDSGPCTAGELEHVERLVLCNHPPSAPTSTNLWYFLWASPFERNMSSNVFSFHTSDQTFPSPLCSKHFGNNTHHCGPYS